MSLISFYYIILLKGDKYYVPDVTDEECER